MTVSRKQRIFALISALLFGVVILGSLAFIAAESGHVCADDNCRICEAIQQSEKLLSSAGGAVIAGAVRISVIFAFIAVLLCGRVFCKSSTLISLKVELLD